MFLLTKNEGTFFDLNEQYNIKRRTLNKVVLEGIGYDNRVEEIEKGWFDLINLRMKMGGQKKDVLIETMEKEYKKEISGAVEIIGNLRLSKSLDPILESKTIGLDEFLT